MTPGSRAALEVTRANAERERERNQGLLGAADELAEINRKAAPEHREVERFLLEHGDLPAAQLLKSKWLRRLARDGEWSLFHQHYDESSRDAGLDCQVTLQRWREGNATEAMQRATELWTVGRSQPKDCDPLFERWKQAGGLTETVAWQRIRLALLYRQDALAQYLTRYVPSQKALAERFIERSKLLDMPADVLAQRSVGSQGDAFRIRLVALLELETSGPLGAVPACRLVGRWWRCTGETLAQRGVILPDGLPGLAHHRRRVEQTFEQYPRR